MHDAIERLTPYPNDPVAKALRVSPRTWDTCITRIIHQAGGGALPCQEGLEEMFTINRLGLSRSLQRSFGSTKIIESAISGVKRRTGRVRRWREGSMVKRWAASSLLDKEKKFL